MADTSTNLQMPFILPSQAQKHVTHNEALLTLDAVVHLSIAGDGSTPPPMREEGACYRVAEGASDAWAGKQGWIAAWQDGAWRFIRPRTGWRAWFVETSTLEVFDGTAWQDIPLPRQGSFDELGIGATADAVNRLALASPASLFNHAGNGHQVKVNKAAAADTASLLFQSDWVGHAEMGLAGNNEFSLKVSNGSEWKTAIAVSASGHVSKPAQPVLRAYRSGTSFTPVAGQQSGMTDFAVNQGGFVLGPAISGGGNAVIVPASGLYQIHLNLALASSSGHEVKVLRNGAESLLTIIGRESGVFTQSATTVVFLASSDLITLGHEGTAEIRLGNAATGLMMIML
jgi:hypothetical protein